MNIVAGGCLPLPPQHQWHDALYTVPAKENAAFYRQQVGEPDFKLSMMEFANRLDSTPQRYTTYVRGNKVEARTYQDYVLHELWSMAFRDEIWRGEDPIPYDPRWYQKPPFVAAELWVYDESRRFDNPKWNGNWTCYILPFVEGRCIGRWFIGNAYYGWNPTLFIYPDGKRQK
jgi:hypothetical protein